MTTSLWPALVSGGETYSYNVCQAVNPVSLAPTPGEYASKCQALEAVIRKPSGLPLDRYEQALNHYFGNYCYRAPEAHWRHDKFIRATGPFISTLANGKWSGANYGTHAPVMIWYSPEMMDWLKANRPAEGKAPAEVTPVPDGALMVKEMYQPPSSTCRNEDPLKLKPQNGAAIMVRDRQVSHDGWFWGWYGYGGIEKFVPDWVDPRTNLKNSIPNMGFAQYCLNCHASATDNSTFASLRNVAGEPGHPITFLTQDFWPTPPPPGLDKHVAHATQAPEDLAALTASHPLDKPLLKALGVAPVPDPLDAYNMPSQTFDNTWVHPGGPHAKDTFITSSQCLGCHDAGSTGLAYDMTTPVPAPAPNGPAMVNLSPFATWRNSPMGLAGRDPVFFAQLASETQTFHKEHAGLVEDTCLGCHGIMGQRQYHIDAHAKDGTCPDFTREAVNALPIPANNPHAGMANYGALARDGISCATCHRMVLGEAASKPVEAAPQNACIKARQEFLNPHAQPYSLASTFTGSFFVGATDKIEGPFENPKTAPMENALANTPVHDATILTPETCGTCHSVHLPVLPFVGMPGSTAKQPLGYVYEQATYPEWAFSAFRTGQTADGRGYLPGGAGSDPQTCQACHMPNTNFDGVKLRSRIASIQEHSNFPEADNALGGDKIDLPVRDGFARHTLVGLNIFLVKIAQQFSKMLGIPLQDPMMVSQGVNPIDTTERDMLDQAATRTVKLTLGTVAHTKTGLSAAVNIESLAGHRFPSGVGFRRAFVDFAVLDAHGKTLWESGRTNPAGEIVDAAGRPIAGEVWWDGACKRAFPAGAHPYQPHFEAISRQDNAQIYQELVTAPPQGAKPEMCGHDKPANGEMTTSFLSICGVLKDNRILPKGYLPLDQRIAIAKALGGGDDMAVDAGPKGVGNDPAYKSGGGDSLVYNVPLKELHGAKPDRIVARLYYQATPPFYLQDRFCTASGADTGRLKYVTEYLNLDKTKAAGWKFEVASASVALHR